MTSLIGQSLGRYHILEQLGEGGMATVYKAFDTRLEANVAVKVIRTERLAPEIAGRALMRFEREAKALAQLTHPNIVKVTDYGEFEGQPYLVMPYLEGGTLKELLHARGAYPWQEAARLILPVASALEYAHQHNTIHRDVKPSNILITDSGEPMISDFGVAKIIDDETTMDLTGTSATVGTPEYMAPEQVVSKSVDFRADIYALGVVVYEMITGRRPFQADTPMAVLFKHASEPLPRPKLFVPDLPERVEQVLIKALAKKPEDRYQKMSELATALESLLVTQVQPSTAAPVRPHAAVPVQPPASAPVQPSKGSKRPLEAGGFSGPPPTNQIPEPPAPPPMPKSNKRIFLWIGLGIVGLGVLITAGIFARRLIGGIPAASQPTPTNTAFPLPTSTETEVIPVLMPTPTAWFTETEPPVANVVPTATGPVTIRWSIGLGTGTDPAQIPIENAVVADFNRSQSKIHLVDEMITNATARNTISKEIAAGAAPDIIGPVGWLGSNAFAGQWLDIAPYIQYYHYDTSKFEAALTKMYQTDDQGTVGLPFAVYPSAIFYNTGLFNKAGLNPLPAKYGDQYKMPDGSMVDWNWDALTTVAKLLTIDKAGKHSSESGFDANSIVQYGFTFGWENTPSYWATYMSTGGQYLEPGGSKGSYVANIPDAWKTAWQWVYDGIWGGEPYIPNGTVSNSAGLDNGIPFASGKVGMMESPSWTLCCMGDLTKAGGRFDFGAMPIGLDGDVAGRVDADTFRIWKGTKYPNEAFTVLTYLIDTGINKLVVGTPGQAPAYGAIPSQTALRDPGLPPRKPTSLLSITGTRSSPA